MFNMFPWGDETDFDFEGVEPLALRDRSHASRGKTNGKTINRESLLPGSARFFSPPKKDDETNVDVEEGEVEEPLEIEIDLNKRGKK